MGDEALSPSAIWSHEAELCLLGGMLTSPDAIDEARAITNESDLFRTGHRTIWRAAVEIRDNGGAVDMVTLLDHLRTTGELDGAGGAEYVADLIDTVSSAANIQHHARIVREKAQLRRLVAACQETARDATTPNGTAPAEIFELAERRILEIGWSESGGEYRPVSDVIWGALALIEREAAAKGSVTGIPSGFSRLDHMTAGMHPGDLTVLAGRPSMGKTALALSVALSAASSGHPAAIASLEMTSEQLVKRAMAMRAGVNLVDIRRGNLTEAQYRCLSDASTWLNTLPLWIDDQTTGSMAELRVKARRMVAQQKVELLVVDYLQLMDGDGENRERQVSSISRGLKRLARELSVHVLVLSQLSRAVEHRSPPRPQLSDLRDSGAIEQDADVVLLLWRPEYYFDEKTPDEARAKWQGMGELGIGKQRNGPTGHVTLVWDAKTTRFAEPASSVDEARAPAPGFLA